MRGTSWWFALILTAGVTARAGAEGVWAYNQAEYILDGCARVYDGGPEECISISESGEIPLLVAGVVDRTCPGSLCASSAVSGHSQLLFSDESLVVLVSYRSRYLPSLFPGGDRPGGEADGSFSSVIEFVMPADELQWGYFTEISVSPGFAGSTTITVDNVTQSETLLSLIDDPFEFVETTLTGSAGDLIRITSEMSGGGSVPPDIAAIRKYSSRLEMEFIIVPDPATLGLLLPAGALLLGRREA